MILVSTAIMFILMYQLVYSVDHALFSLTRLVSSLVMGCVMTVMLAFMWKMYHPDFAKIGVLVASILLGVSLLLINRSQVLVGDVNFMKAMIPHHSIAINNARRADIRDPRVRYLADRIIRDQVKEIAEMKMLIDDIGRHGRRADVLRQPGPDVLTSKSAQEAKDLLEGKLLQDEPL